MGCRFSFMDVCTYEWMFVHMSKDSSHQYSMVHDLRLCRTYVKIKKKCVWIQTTKNVSNTPIHSNSLNGTATPKRRL